MAFGASDCASRDALGEPSDNPTLVINRLKIPCFALIALIASFGTACRRSEVQARCTVRTAGSYCTFQNTGSQTARACFRVSVGPPRGFVTYASAHACSNVLHPGERSVAVPIQFDEGNPFERCTVEPSSGVVRGCETRVNTERIETGL